MNRVFEIKIIQPNFDDYYKKLQGEISKEKSGVDFNILIAMLNRQYTAQEDYFKDPFSKESIEWVSTTKQLIAKVDFGMSKEFNNAISEYEKIKITPIVRRGLPELIKSKISKQILDAKNYLVFSDEKIEEARIEKVYEGGNSYAFLMDIIDIIKGANQEIFIIDPYFDDERFNLFVQKFKDGIKIKILIGSITARLNSTIVDTFKKSNTQIDLSVKKSGEIHDRLIFADDRCWIMGQSIKNAAESKPTYIVEIIDNIHMRKIYEDIWDRATSY